MKWQFKLGRFAGIDVFVHATFLLIVGWYAYMYGTSSGSLAGALEGVFFILLLFLMVTLHEYGHALTARKFGVKTRDITLYPIGGVARLERMPEKPVQELWVALAGPAVSLALGIGLFIILALSGGLSSLNLLSLTSGSMLQRLALINIVLAGFNMIPAFPMDGGRVLRALLAMRLDYVRATQVAASIGQGLAFLFGFWGLFNNPFMLFIALFVWMGAGQEASMVQVRYALDGIPVTRAMLTDYQVLSPEDTLGEMARQMLAGIQQDFPVVQDGKMLGVVTRRDFLAALTARGDCVPVSEVMRSGAPEVDSHDMLEKALARLQESGVPMVPVVHAGELVGILTSENITEFLMIRSARRAAPPAVQGGPCAEPG